MRTVAIGFAAGICALVFAVSSVLFSLTAMQTRELMARDGQWRMREFEAVNDYNQPAVALTLFEYGELKGYKDEKAALRGFLERNRSVPYRSSC